MCLLFKKILFASGDTQCSCSKTTVLFIMLTAKSLAYSRYAEKETEKVGSQTKDKVKHGGVHVLSNTKPKEICS